MNLKDLARLTFLEPGMTDPLSPWLDFSWENRRTGNQPDFPKISMGVSGVFSFSPTETNQLIKRLSGRNVEHRFLDDVGKLMKVRTVCV